MSEDGFLHKYYLNNAQNHLHKWFHYFDIYEHHFSRFRGKRPVMVEIGVYDGGSLLMWKDYFGEGCKIVGVDINPDCKAHEREDIEVFIGSQDEPDLISAILEKYPDIDIVLDDGSHIMHHMIATFDMLYERLQPKGVYMVEDAHTCYWPAFGGGLKAEGSFMEYVKDRMDDLNAVHTQGVVPISALTRSTRSITCYDSVIVFERQPQGERQSVATRRM